MAASPALDLAKPAHQRQSVLPVSPPAMLPTQPESALPSVEMGSSLEMRVVILGSVTQLGVSPAKSNPDIAAVDNPQFASPIPLPLPQLPLPHLRLPQTIATTVQALST